MGFLSVLSMAHKWVAERTAPGDTVIDATAGGGVDTLALAELLGPKGFVYAFDVQQDALDRTRARLVAAGSATVVEQSLEGAARASAGTKAQAGMNGGLGAQEAAMSVGGRSAERSLSSMEEWLPDESGTPSARHSGQIRGNREVGRELSEVRLCLADHAEMASIVKPEHAGRVAAVMFNLGYLPGGDTSVITQPTSTLHALEAALRLLRPGGIITCVLYPGHPGGYEEAQAVEAWTAGLPRTLARAIMYKQPQRPDAPYLIALERGRANAL